MNIKKKQRKNLLILKIKILKDLNSLKMKKKSFKTKQKQILDPELILNKNNMNKN